VVVLLTELLVGNLVPHTPAIRTDFDALGPATPTIRPPREADLAVVDDNIITQRRHDRTRNWHSLNTKPIAIRHVLLPQLRRVVQILLHLHRRQARVGNDVDAREPLAAARADVAHHHHPQRETMDGWEGFAVHLPREQHFVDFYFADRHRDGVVVHLAFFEVSVCAEELDVRAFIFQAAVFQHLFQGDARPARGPDCAFAPGGVDELVAVAGVLRDLLDAAGAAALEGDDGGLAREEGFVLEGGEGDFLGGVDVAFDFEEVFAWVDFGDAAVVADEEVGVFGDFGLGELVYCGGWRVSEMGGRAWTRRFWEFVS
jgi:hypothetical protein